MKFKSSFPCQSSYNNNMKVPNGSDDVFEWVEIEKSVTIIRNPPYDNSDILTVTYIKGDPASRFIRVSSIWSLDHLIMMCDLNGIPHKIIDSFDDVWKYIYKIL